MVGGGETADEVRERLRERLRSLPAGLQEGQEGEQPPAEVQPEQPPQVRGIDLAPSGGYNDPFSQKSPPSQGEKENLDADGDGQEDQ